MVQSRRAGPFLPTARGPEVTDLPTPTLLDTPTSVAPVAVQRIIGAQTIQTGQVPVVADQARVVVGPDVRRRTVTIRNIGGSDAYIGDRAVSIQTGYRLAAGGADPPLILELAGFVYAIGTGATTLHWLAETDAGPS